MLSVCFLPLFLVMMGISVNMNGHIVAVSMKNTSKMASLMTQWDLTGKHLSFSAVAAVALGIWLWAIRNRKLIADETELIVSGKQRIPYDSMEKIDKTLFKEKGFFIITYKDEKSGEVGLKLSDRTYDNLAALLDHLVAKIS